MQAIDCSTRLNAASVAALKQVGIQAVGRYLGYNLGWWKSLTPDELQAIRAAGLSVWLIWESNPTYVGYFSYQRGFNDAQAAIKETQFLGAPKDAAIYFTVDYDVQQGDMAAIIDYFRGVRDSMAGQYLIGAYGSYQVMEALKNSPYAPDKYFQTYAWSAGQEFPAHIYQWQNDATIQGMAVDQDTINENAGLWPEIGGNDVENIVIYADGDVGTALLKSYELGCPMIHKDFAASVNATNKHWIGVQGTNGNGNYYYSGSDRIATAKYAL